MREIFTTPETRQLFQELRAFVFSVIGDMDINGLLGKIDSFWDETEVRTIPKEVVKFRKKKPRRLSNKRSGKKL